MTTPTGPVASVVIPVRNGAATLARQLSALAVQDTGHPFEVLVADNGSTDDTVAVARAWQGRLDLRILAAEGPPSVAIGRNAGLAAAGTALVLVCDADDVVDPSWVEAMVAGLRDADIVGGRLRLDRLNPPDVVEWYGRRTMDALPRAFGYRPYAVGACLGVRAEVAQVLGGFDPAYPGGQEEVDFCWRAQDRGFTLAFAPDAVVDYRLRSTLRGLWRQTYRYGRAYALLYSRWRDRGIPPPRIRSEIRYWLILVGRIPHLLRTPSRGRWVRNVAWGLGRLRGSLECGLRCPL